MSRGPANLRTLPVHLLVLATVVLAGLFQPVEARASEEAWYRLGCLANWERGGCACAELPYWPTRCIEEYYGCIYPSFRDSDRALCESWCAGHYSNAYDHFCIATPSTIPTNQCWSCVGIMEPPEPLPTGPGGPGPMEEENQDVPDAPGGPIDGGCYLTRVCTYFPNGQVECGPEEIYCD